MTDAIWTIAILTINGREAFYQRLRSVLDPQIANNPVHVLVLKDNKELSIGAKRQKALDICETKYINFIDDDDLISTKYVQKILNELEQGPCGVGFRGIVTSKSMAVTEFVHKAGLAYSVKPQKYGGSIVYTRPLNHLNPVKTHIAQQIGFKDLGFAEDLDYSLRLSESGLIQDSVFIDDFLYFYQYRAGKNKI